MIYNLFQNTTDNFTIQIDTVRTIQRIFIFRSDYSHAVPFKAGFRAFKSPLGVRIDLTVILGSCYKRPRRKCQSVTAKREKSQTPQVLTAILTLPNLT